MENPGIKFHGDQELLNLPPGFRFHPTDEELVSHYLSSKTLDVNFSATAIGEADFNKCEPWELPKVANMEENEWYFFSLRDRKYPTGQRTNRATLAGYWKATGKDKEIYKATSLVGMKKTLVFYIGRAPRGVKTNWIMHEFRLFPPQNPSSSNNEWVICRVFHKNSAEKKSSLSALNDPSSTYINDQASLITGVSSSNVPCFATPYSGQNPALNPNGYYPGNETGYPVFQPQTDPFDPNAQYPFANAGLSQDTGFSSELNPEASSGVSSYDMGGDPFVGQGDPSGSMPGPDDLGPFWGYD